MKRNLLKLTMTLAILGLPAMAVGQTARLLPGQSYVYPGDDVYQNNLKVSVSDDGSPSDVHTVGDCTSKGCTGCTNCAASRGCTDPGHSGCTDGGGCSCCDPIDQFMNSGCDRGLWGSVEYMYVWTKGRATPPLVTTSSNADEGVLGRPTTSVLFGGDEIGRSLQSGGRVFAGKWLDAEGYTGVGVRFMGIEGDRTNFHRSSAGVPLLAVPFFNVDPLVAAPDSVMAANATITGSIGVKTSNDVYSVEPLLRIGLRESRDYRIDLIGGYHHTLINDGLSMNTVLQQGATLVHFRDDFNARNEFHGGSFGFIADYGTGPWSTSLLAKLSVGKNFEEVRIDGQNVTAVGAGAPAVAAGGIFAQNTNIGTYFRDEIVYVPEVAMSLNRQINSHLDISIGYSFMYWSEVLLAGDQIDTSIDGGLLQGGPGNNIRRPAFNFRETDFYLHAMTFGVNFHY